jgi:hypothetical protein
MEESPQDLNLTEPRKTHAVGAIVAGSFLLAVIFAAVLTINHSPLNRLKAKDPELFKVINDSGLGALLASDGIKSDRTYFAGQVRFIEGGRGIVPQDAFRMALMIVPVSGEPIQDFFHDLNNVQNDSRIVGRGNSRLKIWVPDFIMEKYPDLKDKDQAEMTFREFSNHESYFLENVPEGTAYIWFQFGFDGNRIIQVPIVTKLVPKPGEIVKMDFSVDAIKAFVVL